MGKNKLARWNELATFENVIQPEIGEISAKDHPIKGNWNKDMFRNRNPLILELGCGKGEYTTGLATRFPENNFIGIDIKGARMWRGAKTASQKKLNNVAFLRTRIEFINSFFAPDEVDEIWITFPDPHPGGRNAGKRLTSPGFLNDYHDFLKNNGIVHLKTDNIELFNFTKRVVTENDLDLIFSTNDLYSGNNDSQLSPAVKSCSGESVPENYLTDELLSIRTHYENIFLAKGMKINYLSFRLGKEKIIEDAIQETKRG